MRDALRRMVRRGAREGLLRGTFGNVSLRVGEDLLITPTGRDYLRLRAEDFALVRIADGAVRSGDPSSELPLHLAVYRGFQGVSAVFHNHSPYAVAAGLIVDELPLFTGEGHGLIGEYLPVAPYRAAGSWELADLAVKRLAESGASACLLRNHGLVALGAGLFPAYACAIAVEEAALHYLLTLGLRPQALPVAERTAIRAGFSGYHMR